MRDEATQWFAILHWNATCKAWTARTDTEEIIVPEATYRRLIQEHLARKGIEMQTWTHFMQSAEEAWKRQYEEEQRLQENLDLWKSLPGVAVVSRNKDRTISAY